MPQEPCKTQRVRKPRILLPLSIIMILFIGLTTVTIGLVTWYFTSVGGESSALAFAAQLQEVMADHAKEDILMKIQNAERLSLTQQYNWKKGIYDPDNKTKVMEQLFPQLLMNQDNVISQSFTTLKGELWGFYTYFSKPGDPSTRKYSKWVQYDKNYTEYDIDKDLNVLGINFSSNTSDNSQGSWVTMVNHTNPSDVAWSGAYVWQDKVWLTNSVPMINTKNEPFGVCSTDLDLQFINSMLQYRVASVKKAISLFVVEAKTELVIGASENNLTMMYTDSKNNRPLTTAELGLQLPILKALDSSLAARSLEYNSINQSLSFMVKTDQKAYMVAIQPIQWRSMHWVVIQFLERDEIYGPINAASIKSLTAMLSIVLVSLTCGILLAWAVSKSLGAIVTDLNRLETFNFAAVYKGKERAVQGSFIREIFRIQVAFNLLVMSYAGSLKTATNLIQQPISINSEPSENVIKPIRPTRDQEK